MKENLNTIDKIVFWNGSGAVEKDICEELGIKACFIENGYFPNTLQVNSNGVNCDVEFAQLSLIDFLQFTFKETQHKQKSDFVIQDVPLHTVKRFLYRLFDDQYNFLTIESLMHNIRMGKAKKRFASLPVDELDIDSLKKYIFFPLQVNSDTQIVLNSRYTSMYDVLEIILPKLLETGYNIILKEHPAEMEKVDYSSFVDNKRVFLTKKFDIDALIKHAEFVVCVNSSVGLQALAAARKTLILGKSMYDSCPGAIVYDEVKSVLEQIDAVSIDEVSLEKYISHFKEKIFIKGNWRQPTIEFLHGISCRIDAV
ncbi:MAG: hypothetical protein IPO21_01975 [Bacteroidales bacterium]|nr:hypothetical protein [Bacteroidales bacterium]